MACLPLPFCTNFGFICIKMSHNWFNENKVSSTLKNETCLRFLIGFPLINWMPYLDDSELSTDEKSLPYRHSLFQKIPCPACRDRSCSWISVRFDLTSFIFSQKFCDYFNQFNFYQLQNHFARLRQNRSDTWTNNIRFERKKWHSEHEHFMRKGMYIK